MSTIAPDSIGNRIERIEEVRLSDADANEISNLLNVSFDGEFADRSFFAQRHHVRLIKRHREKIVGHVALSFRAMRIGDALVNIIAVGDVAVAESVRRQGLGASLVEAAITEAEQTSASFMMLFGGFRIYERAGFKIAKNPLIWVEQPDFHTTKITRRSRKHLMIFELGSASWDQIADVDLLGCLF